MSEEHGDPSETILQCEELTVCHKLKFHHLRIRAIHDSNSDMDLFKLKSNVLTLKFAQSLVHSIFFYYYWYSEQILILQLE